MPNYRFVIRNADHIDKKGEADFHVHVYYNEGRSSKLLGRYRLPSLEPIFSNTKELNNREVELLRQWLAQETQQKKLQNALKSTLFKLDKEMKNLQNFSEIILDTSGDTYLTIKIPVSKRL